MCLRSRALGIFYTEGQARIAMNCCVYTPNFPFSSGVLLLHEYIYVPSHLLSRCRVNL